MRHLLPFRHVCSLLGLITGFMLWTMPAYSASPHSSVEDIPQKVPHLLKMALEAQDKEVVLQNMRNLVAIGDQKAATAFTEVFKLKVSRLKLPVRQFIVLVSKFEYAQDTKEEIEVLLRELFDKYDHALTDAPPGFELTYQYRTDIIKIAGILAAFGDKRSLEYLIDEYRKSRASKQTIEEENIQGDIFEELCKSNQSEASQFIIDELPNSMVLPSMAIGVMLEANNPYALEVARQYITVGSDDFDLIEAKLYLKAIIQFGDQTDRTFLDHLSEYIEQPLHTLMKDDLHSLMIQAYEKLDNGREE